MSLCAKPELLAPVGSLEALTAAVRCGADAVYLGAGRFHARQHADPFDDDALASAVAFCHARGVKVHLTLNTLVMEEEFEAAMKEAQRAAALGVDALIVQDRGLAAAIHRAAPELCLHASTQLSCHTPQGVKELLEAGFSRVVLAREMSKKEIAACCAVGGEIEVFVHGALCMSVSGQCFLSAFLGGRSGNRGRCAQPCRLPFAIGTRPQETDRALSLKDLSLCAVVGEMASMGVASLKIEGRMKRPEYVAAAVSVCRAAIDGKPIDEELLADLQRVFSRSGFTDGYYRAKRSIAMFGSRTKDDVIAAPAAHKRLARLYLKERTALPLSMRLTMRKDAPMTLSVTDRDGNAVTAAGDAPRPSSTPIDDTRLQAALQKLGGTPFFADTVTVERDKETDAPLSAVNALRREAVERLMEIRGAVTPVSFEPYVLPPQAKRADSTPSLVVRLASFSQWSEPLARLAALVVLPLGTAPADWQTASKVGAVAAEIPRGLFGNEAAIEQALLVAKENGVRAAVCHNVGALPLCRKMGLPMIGGFGLHTANAVTCDVHAQSGLVAATASMELSFRKLAFVRSAPLPVGAMMYGRMPLMLLRNCPASAQQGCGGCRGDRTLTDRKGAKFPLMCQGGCADLLNSVPLYLADRAKDAPPFAFWTLYMTDEAPGTVLAVTKDYAAAAAGNAVRAADEMCPHGFTRGLVFKGVE